MNVCFIAHGDADRGMGHVMRCIALAEALESIGVESFFISEGERAQKIIKGKGFQVIPIKTKLVAPRNSMFWYGDKKELNKEIEIVEKILSVNNRINLTIIDTYNVSNQYFRMIKQYSDLVCYVDDLNAFNYDVDIILNGTLGAYNLDYQWFEKMLLKGLNYLLLRKEFWNIPQIVINKKIKNVLITTGGADPDNMTNKIIEAIYDEHLQETNIHLMIGSGFNNISFLQNKWGEKGNVKIHLFPNRIAPLMLKCDLAVSAGGTTVYELGVCQVPTIAFVYAKNQEGHIRKLYEQGLIEYVGPSSNWNKEVFKTKYKELSMNFDKREKMARKFRTLVTGNGAINAAERMIAEIKKTKQR